MSKLLENKQMIHIATEIVVLIGITFYFSSKNKKLSEYIEDLSQRLEDQEDLIQKHEQIIRQLVQAVNTQTDSVKPHDVRKKKYKSKPTSQTTVSDQHQSPIRPVTVRQSSIRPTVSFNDNDKDSSSIKIEEYSSDNDSDNDSDLDDEISDELHELQQQDGLKKRI